MKISVLAYSFRGLYNAGMMDIFGFLESCKYRYHLDGADLWSGFFPTTDEEFVQKVRQAVLEKDMVVADIAVDGAHVWEPDPAQRQQHYLRSKRFLEIADTLGCKFVRIDADGSRETMQWSDKEFDFIAQRYKEYAQFAYDHGFRVGIENHWGPEKVWSNLKRMYEAVSHPGFGVSCHLASWAGPVEEQAIADAAVAPWAGHTHIPWNVCEGPLITKLGNLWKAGYQGYYSVEHHTAENEYSEVGTQIAKVRDALSKLRLADEA